MKKMLYILQVSAMIACSISLAMSAASTSSAEQENMFKELVDLSKNRLELYALLRLFERTPGGLRTRLVEDINDVLIKEDAEINNLNRQLKDAGFEQDQIDYVVNQSLQNLISPLYGTFINRLILSDKLSKEEEAFYKNRLLSILLKRQ